MALSLICNTDDANQLDRVVLDIDGENTVLFIKLRWHRKIQKWMMSIFDEENKPKVRNVPLVSSVDYPSANLLRQFDYLGIGVASVLPSINDPTTLIPSISNLGANKEWGLVWGLPYE